MESHAVCREPERTINSLTKLSSSKNAAPVVSGGGTASDASTSSGSKMVWFADEVSETLAEVIEVESLKTCTRFTRQDRVHADRAWQTELLILLDSPDIAVQRSVVSRVQGAVLELALADAVEGCLVVQGALAVAPLLDRVPLIRELHGSVAQLLRSDHGARVLLYCAQLLPTAACFVAKEIEGHAVVCAQTSGGIEILCSALQNRWCSQTSCLVAELLQDVESMCCDTQKASIVDCLLEYGSAADQNQMRSVLIEKTKDMRGEARRILEERLQIM